MPETIQNNPKVFISYSHDLQEHMDRVLSLSLRLREDGVDCIIDQYETSPSTGWARWMIAQIQKADFVLIVCTKMYQLRFEGEEEYGKGKGAKWEGALIIEELYKSEAKNDKFIPILFSSEDEAHIPIVLKGATHYKLEKKEGYESLYRHITHQPLILKPDMGKLKVKPPLLQSKDASSVPCNVPFQRNPYFTGREDVLKQLHSTLKSKKTTALAQAISGLGGIGKTQTAVEYTYRYGSEYNAVLWVKGDSCEALISDYAALAHVLDLLEKNAKEQNLIVAAVRRWLENNSGWLLVFDNADEPGLLEDYIPNNPKGHIFLTSRAQVFDTLGISNPVELEKMPPDEAKEFLQKRTGRKDLHQTEIEALGRIAEELDYLPLALEQAGAYINKLKCSFSDYLSSYKNCGLMLLQESFPVAGKYPKSITTTWLLNFEQVEKTSKASADLLTASTFLNPDNIPLELNTQSALELGEAIPEALANIKTNPLVLDKLLLPLTQYSLITRDISARTYSIHRLVQSVIRDRLGKDAERMWAERTVKAVNRAFPVVEFATWHLCDRLLPHTQVCIRLIEKYEFKFKLATRLLNQCGYYLNERALFVDAELPYVRALEISEKELGKNHLDVATSLNNLAGLYYAQGKLTNAEPLYTRALAIKEKALGKDHPIVATSLNNLGLLYHAQGKLKDAELLYCRALAIREKSLDKDHQDVATSLNNLAGLYIANRKFEDTEQL